MTDQLFHPGPAMAEPLPLRPAERYGRWVLHRAGIVNVWQYDRTEIDFAGGRALLRGKNGAGKSKALEVLLPFLLDGDIRAMDAAGRDRTSVYWLMTDGRDPGNHVGYVWFEMRLSDETAVTAFSRWGRGSRPPRRPARIRAGSSWPREPGSASICTSARRCRRSGSGRSSAPTPLRPRRSTGGGWGCACSGCRTRGVTPTCSVCCTACGTPISATGSRPASWPADPPRRPAPAGGPGPGNGGGAVRHP